MKRTVETDPVLCLIDVVIADLAVGPVRYISRRPEDGDAETFVIQDGEEGRLRLGRPDLSSPASVVAMAEAAQSCLHYELDEPTPRCPLHEHALGLATVDGGFDWVCPEARWRCGLGDYAEQAWPHFSVGQLAPILSRRLERRGITGVRSFGVAEGEKGLLATFAVADLTPELVAALTDAAAPLGVAVHEAHRAPRRQVAPVPEAAASAPAPASAVSLLLATASARPGGNLGFTVVNDGSVSLLMGVEYVLDQQDGGWWWQIDLECWFPAVGLIVEPAQRRDLTARIPDRCPPGIYRLRKSLSKGAPDARSWGPDDDRVEVTAEFRVEKD